MPRRDARLTRQPKPPFHLSPHRQSGECSVREELKLNRADVSWYQIRKALEARNKDGDSVQVSFETFKKAYETLGDKLRPMVLELGFMR